MKFSFLGVIIWWLTPFLLTSLVRAAEPVADLRAKAENGDPAAMLALAKHLKASPAADDSSNAAQPAKWIRLAAEKKLPEAMYEWGVLLASGEGMARDFPRAQEFITAAAEEKHAPAQSYLAGLHATGSDAFGNRVGRNVEEAIRWHYYAAEEGDPVAMLKMAELLDQLPQPTEQTRVEAKQWRDGAAARKTGVAASSAPSASAAAIDPKQQARLALEKEFTALETEFAAARDAKAREEVAGRMGRLLYDQYDKAGMSELEGGEWALRRLLPQLQRHSAEAWALILQLPDGLVPKQLRDRVLPADLSVAVRAQAQRMTDEYQANERKWEAVRRAHPAAEKGDARAQLAVGLAYLQAPGGESAHWANALHWLTLAHKNGAAGAAAPGQALALSVKKRYDAAARNPAALLELHRQRAKSKLEDAHVGAYLAAMVLLNGHDVVEKDYVEAKAWLEAAAQKKHGGALFELAQLELIPRHGEGSEAAALKWLQAAASAGHPTAGEWIDMLGLPPAERAQRAVDAGGNASRVTTVGSSTTFSFGAARPWFRYAAHLGHPQAWEFEGAQEHMRPKPDLKRAFAFFLRAAEAGRPASMGQVAEAYQSGRGTPANLAAARAWRLKAAAAGGMGDQSRAGEMLLRGEGGPVDYAGARGWFLKAAEQGQLTAMLHLGEMAFDGQGMAKSDAEAVAWWQRAADKNYGDAQLRLALMYRDGRGVARNLETARTLLTAAVGRGNTQAAELLKALGDGASAPPAP